MLSTADKQTIAVNNLITEVTVLKRDVNDIARYYQKQITILVTRVHELEKLRVKHD